MIDIKLEHLNDHYAMISFIGKLHYEVSRESKEKLTSLIQNHKGYILDLQQVESIDSTGFGVIISVTRKISPKNVVVIINNPIIENYYKIAKLDTIVQMTENIQAAIEKLEENNLQK